MILPIEEIWLNRKVVKVTLRGIKNKPGIAADIFDVLNSKGINVQMVVSGATQRGRTDIAMLLPESGYIQFKDFEEDIVDSVSALKVTYEPNVALFVFYGDKKISRMPGIAGRIFNVFADYGINIEMVSTSLDSISIVVHENRVETAQMVLEDTLGADINWRYNYYED